MPRCSIHFVTFHRLSLHWRHNGHDSVSNHKPHDCLLNRLFRRRSKKISKFRVTGLCAGNSPETGEFPAQMASKAENVSIWWPEVSTCGCISHTTGFLVWLLYDTMITKLSNPPPPPSLFLSLSLTLFLSRPLPLSILYLIDIYCTSALLTLRYLFNKYCNLPTVTNFWGYFFYKLRDTCVERKTFIHPPNAQFPRI